MEIGRGGFVALGLDEGIWWIGIGWGVFGELNWMKSIWWIGTWWGFGELGLDYWVFSN
jgi:hypothetical protein